MKKVIGYLEGTDPIWLTSLNAQGHTTLPVSNGFDGHGMNIAMFSQTNRVDVVVAYLHKLLPAEGMDFDSAHLLHATTVYGIPVLVVCPKELETEARQVFGKVPDNVRFIDPGELLAVAISVLEG